MELGSINISGCTHNFEFLTEEEIITIEFEWENTFKPIPLLYVDLFETTEKTIRKNVTQLGFYSDDRLRIQLFKQVFPYLIRHYNYPIAHNSFMLPNREMIIVSWANAFATDEAHLLVEVLMNAQIQRTPLVPIAEEQDEEETLYKTIIESDDEVIEVIEEIHDEVTDNSSFKGVVVELEDKS